MTCSRTGSIYGQLTYVVRASGAVAFTCCSSRTSRSTASSAKSTPTRSAGPLMATLAAGASRKLQSERRPQLARKVAQEPVEPSHVVFAHRQQAPASVVLKRFAQLAEELLLPFGVAGFEGEDLLKLIDHEELPLAFAALAGVAVQRLVEVHAGGVRLADQVPHETVDDAEHIAVGHHEIRRRREVDPQCREPGSDRGADLECLLERWHDLGLDQRCLPSSGR